MTWYNPSGGYEDEQLDENVFRVAFFGNGPTSMQRAADLALLRAAELTLEHGYAYLVIQDSEMRVGRSQSVSTSSAQSSAGPVSFGASTSFALPMPYPWYEVACYVDPPETEAQVFDAQSLRDSLRRKYELTEE